MKYISEIQRRREKRVSELQRLNKYLPKRGTSRFNNQDGYEYRVKERFLTKALIGIILFISIYFIFQSNHPYALTSQQHIKDALTRDFNFKGVYNLYQEKFSGSPAILPTFDIVNKEEVKPALKSPITALPLGIEQADTGIYIETVNNQEVVAMDMGLVTKIGLDEKLGSTVIIRHQNGIESTYSMLNNIDVEVDEWLNAGQPIGTVNNKLYVAIKNQKGYLNPLEVIAFD